MTFKSLFQASFEESLNLQDDISFKVQNPSYQKIMKDEPTQNSLKTRILLILFSFLFPILGNYWLVISSQQFSHDKAQVINLLPVQVYWLGLIIWCGLIVYGRRFSQNYLRIFRTQFHIHVVYFNWFLVEINLNVLTHFFSLLKVYGVLIFLMLFYGSSYLIFKYRINGLVAILSEHKEGNHSKKSLDRIVHYFYKHCRWFILIGLVTSISIRRFVIQPTIFGNQWLYIVGWYIVLIVTSFVQAYITLPYFLQPYYRYKYPEAYREWEGKTVEEWYGKQYLSKKEIADDL